MKTTPLNITAHADGYLVRIVRGDLRWRAFVPYSHPDALAEAVRRRDRFYEVCGPVKVHGLSTKARSNTGIVGISDTIHRRNGHALNCLIVSTPGKRKRFYYGWNRPRSAALKQAVAHRLQATGQQPATQQPGLFL